MELLRKTIIALIVLPLWVLTDPFPVQADNAVLPIGFPLAGHLELGAGGQSVSGGGPSGSGFEGKASATFYMGATDLTTLSGSFGYLESVRSFS